MPKAVLIAPWSDQDGKPHAAGEEVDLSDEEYTELRSRGAVQNVNEPYAGQEGHYGDVTTRSDVQGTATVGDTAVNEPETDEPDEPKASTRKR